MNGRRRGPRPVRPRRQAVLQRSGRQLCINIIVSAEAVWQLAANVRCRVRAAKVCRGFVMVCR